MSLYIFGDKSDTLQQTPRTGTYQVPISCFPFYNTEWGQGNISSIPWRQPSQVIRLVKGWCSTYSTGTANAALSLFHVDSWGSASPFHDSKSNASPFHEDSKSNAPPFHEDSKSNDIGSACPIMWTTKASHIIFHANSKDSKREQRQCLLYFMG